MVWFYHFLFLFHFTNASTSWHITVSCQDNATFAAPDFTCAQLVPFCYEDNLPAKYDHYMECSLGNSSEIKLTVYKLFIELPGSNLSVLSGPVVVKLVPVLPNNILALISKLEAPVSVSVRRKSTLHSLTGPNGHVSTVYDQASNKLTTLLSDGIRLPCALFDRPGNFTICLKAGEMENAYVRHEFSTCTCLLVHPWKGYAIQMRTDRLFPCEGFGVSVSTKTPNCSNDVVLHQLRLLAVRSLQYSPMETRRRGVYVGERRLQPGMSVVNFHCNHFDLIYPQYCFQLVSILSDGYVQQHAQQCVSTELKSSIPVHGRWSAWKAWSSCSSGCNAVRHRFRFCDDPPPRFGGQFCDGAGMETAQCNISCQGVTKSKQRIDESGICKCGGCTLTTAGAIVTFSGMCVNSSYWYVLSPDNETLIRWWTLSSCLPRSNERLKIRDGIGPSSPALFDSNGHSFSNIVVMASGPSSTLELQIIPNSSGFEKDSGIINNVVETDLLNVCIFHYSFVRSEHLRSYLIGEKWLSLKEALHVGLTASISAVVFIGLSVVTLLCMRKRLGKFFHSVANSKGKTSLMNTSICKVALLESTHSCGENVHSSDYLPPEMMNSTRTQMTQMSVEDRSKSEEPKASWSRMAIVSPRDRLPSRDGTANQRDGAEKSVPSSFKRTDSTSQLSFVENEQEFEYDYYDAPVMGSILNPLQPWELIDNDFDFCSE